MRLIRSSQLIRASFKKTSLCVEKELDERCIYGHKIVIDAQAFMAYLGLVPKKVICVVLTFMFYYLNLFRIDGMSAFKSG